MARARRQGGQRLEELLSAGDHASALAEARRLAADEAAPEADRDRARRVLASLSPEPGAVAVGLGGLAAALAITLWILAR